MKQYIFKMFFRAYNLIMNKITRRKYINKHNETSRYFILNTFLKALTCSWKFCLYFYVHKVFYKKEFFMLLISQYLIRIVNQIRDKKNLSFSHGKNSIELFQKNYVSPSSVEDNGINIEKCMKWKEKKGKFQGVVWILMEFQGVDEKYWKISGDGEMFW